MEFSVKDYDGKEFWAGWASARATIADHGLAFTQDFLHSKEPYLAKATEPAVKSYWLGYGAHIAYHIWK